MTSTCFLPADTSRGLRFSWGLPHSNDSFALLLHATILPPSGGDASQDGVRVLGLLTIHVHLPLPWYPLFQLRLA